MRRFIVRRAVMLMIVIGLMWFGSSPFAQAQAPHPLQATQSVVLSVPQSMQSAPFDTERRLMVPANFSIEVYARVDGARFMAVAPNGDLLVSQPGAGKVVLIQQTGGAEPRLSDYVTALNQPHDIVFHTIGSLTYVYITETNQIDRFVYNPGDTAAHDREIVVSDLPNSGAPGIGGYAHPLKNIALDSQDKLYVSIGSTCNACLEDTQSDPLRGAIYQYDADGKNGRLFARGLRNAEGLAVLPGTDNLWVAVNNRDNAPVPYTDSPNYGQILSDFVDNYPPDEFTSVRDGGNYGWPFCNPNPTTGSGLDKMPFDLDYDLNADGHVNCGAMDRIDKGIQAHSAALGLIFLQDSAFPAPYRDGAIIALHGSWNRTVRTGYKVVYFPWNASTHTPGAQVELVTGWLDDTTQTVWGRPVDIAVGVDGSLFISDDTAGAIYRLKQTSQG